MTLSLDLPTSGRSTQGGTPIRSIRRRHPLAWLGVLTTFVLVATACVNVANPEGWAAPTQEDDTLFASIENGKMAALDPADFSTKWIFPPNTEAGKKFDLEAIYHAPIVTADTVYFGGYDGNVYALNIASGDPAWDQPFETGGPIIGGLILADDTIFVGSDDGKLYALNPQDGSEKLPPFDAGDSIWAAPLAAGSVLYVPSVNGELYALDAQTLEPLWPEPFKAKAGLLTDPVLADEDTLLVGSIDRRLYALNPETGAMKWFFKADSWFWGQPLVADSTIYVPNLDGHVYALDLEGDLKWSFETEAGVRSSPLLAGDVLIVVDQKGNVYGLNPDTGNLKWSGPAVLEKTVLADPMRMEGDKVLILALGGDLFRISTTTGASNRVEVQP